MEALLAINLFVLELTLKIRLDLRLKLLLFVGGKNLCSSLLSFLTSSLNNLILRFSFLSLSVGKLLAFSASL